MKNIETIFEHETHEGTRGTLGIDNKGMLYWNGKPVVTAQKIKLEWWVNLAAIIAAVSTLVGVIFTALEFFGYGSR